MVYLLEKEFFMEVLKSVLAGAIVMNLCLTTTFYVAIFDIKDDVHTLKKATDYIISKVGAK